MKAEKIAYKGWTNCQRLTNGKIELIVTADVGPRIIRFGFVGGENELRENEAYLGQTGGTEWKNYGGHRLWHAPEEMPRTYAPDNSPVAVEEKGGVLRLVQPVEASTGIQKEIELSMDGQAANVRVVHRLRNLNRWTVRLAPWAITVMEPGGTAILPLPPRRQHGETLLPSNPLVMWAYTDFTDSRYIWGKRCILLKQDSKAEFPQKIGLLAPDGWIAYARAGRMMVVRAPYQAGAEYPDFGSSIESFTNNSMLELETLGPLTDILPDGQVEHTEDWSLYADVPMPKTEADVIRDVLSKIQSA